MPNVCGGRWRRNELSKRAEGWVDPFGVKVERGTEYGPDASKLECEPWLRTPFAQTSCLLGSSLLSSSTPTLQGHEHHAPCDALLDGVRPFRGDHSRFASAMATREGSRIQRFGQRWSVAPATWR